MAKNAGRLAGLAALAGAAYMINEKLKGKGEATPKGKADTGPGYQSTETRLKTPAESIAASDKSDKSNSISTNGRSGTTTRGPDTSAVDLNPNRNNPVVQPVVSPVPEPEPAPTSTDNLTAIAYPRMPGSFQGQNLPAKTVEEAEKNEANAKLVAKSAQEQANKAANAGDIKTASTKYSTATDQYKNLSRAAAVTDARKRAANTLKRQTQLSPFKKGGSVSSASKRADGIASRGKTKCKMY